MSDTLFDMPPKKSKPRKPFEKTQQWTCKRCAGSVHDNAGAYCHRFDLCLEFDSGVVLLASRNAPIQCDGEKWTY